MTGGGGDSTESLSGIKHDFPISMICLTQFRVPDIPLNCIYLEYNYKRRNHMKTSKILLLVRSNSPRL